MARSTRYASRRTGFSASPNWISQNAPSLRFYLAAALMLVCYTFGGRSNDFTMHVYLTATLLIAIAWIWLAPRMKEKRAPDWVLLAVCATPLILHLVQLVPLPPSIWHALPGRALEQDALGLVGLQDKWMPISLDPYLTQTGLFQNIPAFVMLYMTLTLSDRDRTAMLFFIVALGILAILVGSLQLAGGDSNLLRFYSYNYGDKWLTGFNENRNTTAELLNYSLLALCWILFILGKQIPPRRQAVFCIAGYFVFAVAIIATGSRTGMAASLLSLAIMTVIIFSRNFRITGRSIAIGLGLIGLIAASLALLSSNSRIQNGLTRFETTSDIVREHIYEDTLYAIGQYWPVGAGMNSFETVFPVAERLEYVLDRYANRAHDDYLELALEAGIAGIICLVAIVAVLATRIVLNLRSRPSRMQLGHIGFVVSMFLILMLHSLVDYPVRTVGVGVMVGFGIGLVGMGMGWLAVGRFGEKA